MGGSAMRILMKIDSTKPDGKWEALAPLAYSNEAELQNLLDTGSSELIPADPYLDEAHVAFAREVSTMSGPIDLIGIGSSGSITIMECKLARNHQIKREVVGQVLDYAASMWETDIVALSESFRARAGADPFEKLRQQFGEDPGSFEEERCRSEVTRRLREGDFRLLVAVDRIDPELRRIIQYVNSRGGPGLGLRLVALEFPRFQQGVVQVMVPETFGDELAPRPAVVPKGRWDHFQALAAFEQDPLLGELGRDLTAWADRTPGVTYLPATRVPEIIPAIEVDGIPTPIVTLSVEGRVYLAFPRWNVGPLADPAVRERFAADIAAAVRSPKPIRARGWPFFEAANIADPEARARFFDVLSGLVTMVAQSADPSGPPTVSSADREVS
jgi:hypothetical protein